MSQTIELPVMALKPAIAGLSKVVNKRSHLPILGGVKITRRASGELSFEGTDLEATAIYTTDSQKSATDVTVIVPFETLSNVVKGCAKSIFLQLTVEKNSARLRYPVGGSWLEKPIETFKEDEWPDIPRITATASPLESKFKDTFLTALDCASDHKPDLTGGWLDASDPKAHYIVASDGRQLFSANSFKFDLKEPVLIHGHKFLRWSGFVEDGEWKLSVGEPNKDGNGWTQIQSAYWTFMVKRTDARCPLWKQIIPADSKTHVTFSDDAVATLLEVLPQLPSAEKQFATVAFDLESKGTMVRGSDRDHSAQVNIDGVTVRGIPNTFAADRTLIIKALKLGFKDLAIVDGLTPIVFSDATRKFVIAPVRPDSVPTTPSSPAPVPPMTETSSCEPPTTNNEPEGETVKTINRITQSETTTTTSNGGGETQHQPENSSPLKQAMQKVDQIKEHLRDTQGELNDLLKLLGQANRDQRNTEKEVEEVRGALQSLQRIKI